MTSRQPTAADHSAVGAAAASRIPTSHSSNRSPERRSGTSSPASLAAASPVTSRNPSPVRQDRKTASNAVTKPPIEPTSQSSESAQAATRIPSSVNSPAQLPSQATPSAAAVQRALSAANADGRPLVTPNDVVNKQTRVGQDGAPNESNTLHWPKSPRLKSPNPPGNSSTGSRRHSMPVTKPSEGESTEPNTTSAQPAQDNTQQSEPNNKSPPTGPTQPSGATKIPRGFSGIAPTLETVQEGDPSASPSDSTIGMAAQIASPEKQRPDLPVQRNTQEPRPIQNTIREGTVDKSLDKKDESSKPQDQAQDGSQKPPPPVQRKSFNSLAPGKVRQANDGSTNTMTVETETVALVPQGTSTNTNPSERTPATKKDDNGSVKNKTSNETIRPKKDKKKNAKKPSSIISGTGSSKADIFEAKVTSAVDEDDYDSDETFVYESNPPEPRTRPRRHHSRTPSSTSIQSLGERRGGMRPLPNSHQDQQRGVKAKRSMKFASNSYANSSMDEESGEPDAQRARNSSSKTHTPGDSRYHHLYGRRGDRHSQPDPESPYSQAARAQRGSAPNSRSGSAPNSPRNGSPGNLQTPNGKPEPPPYDFDPDRVDDERTPLVETIRSPRRYGGAGLPSSNLRHITYYEEPPRSWLRRCAGCVVLVVILILIIMGSAGFLFATTKALYDVHILAIENVIASEQEIMLDLLVEATNPNIVSISVSNMDINIFARSKYVGSDLFWRHHGFDQVSHPRTGGRSHGARRHLLHSHPAVQATTPPHTQDNVDHGTDPIDDPEGDPQTMLLGRIFHFDNALTFDGSPLRRLPSNSTGELRLEKPGNKTEAGGSERWERVIQHPFELKVRGILKYQLPLSSRIMTASVSASLDIEPDAEE